MDLSKITFREKTAIVTGAAQGIGKAIAEQIAALGGRVVIVDVNMEKAQETSRELGGGAVAYRVDLSNENDIATVFDRIFKDMGRVDILINNAGIVNTAAFENITKQEWDKVLAIDLTAVFLASQQTFRHMAVKGGGRIVNVASVAGQVGGGYLGTAAYAAAKAGVICLTKSIAKAGADKNIYCNSLCPSLTHTSMTSILTGEKEQAVLDSIALHRSAQPHEIANAVVFLASDTASFIDGENLNCDGGLLMNG